MIDKPMTKPVRYRLVQSKLRLLGQDNISEPYLSVSNNNGGCRIEIPEVWKDGKRWITAGREKTSHDAACLFPFLNRTWLWRDLSVKEQCAGITRSMRD